MNLIFPVTILLTEWKLQYCEQTKSANKDIFLKLISKLTHMVLSLYWE